MAQTPHAATRFRGAGLQPGVFQLSMATLFLAVASLDGRAAGGRSADGEIMPPPMPRRAIAPSKDPIPGETIVLNDRGTNFTLFLPHGWTNVVGTHSAALRTSTNKDGGRGGTRPDQAAGGVVLTVHFHSAIWFAIQEHLRRGLTMPMIAFYPGEGSSAYRVPFEDRERFNRWLRMVEGELTTRGAPTNTRITVVDISSFSAGYGAVRELVKSPEYFKLLRRIVLCDSMYASFEEALLTAGVKQPAREHIEPWTAFATAAARGEKTFVLTHSEVPTSNYANSALCAVALTEAVGATRKHVASGSLPATSDPEYPLRFRADRGDFHVWSYGGEDAMAHMTHARHLADVWMVLDAAEARPPDAQ